MFLVFFFTVFSSFPNATRAEYVAAVITATVKSTEIKVIIEPTWVNKLIPVSKKATIILSGEGGYIIKETINRNIKDGTKQEFVTFGGLAPNTKYQIETKLEQVVRDAKAENMQTFVSGAASPEIFKIKTLEKEKDRGFFMPVEPGGKQLILDKSASEVKEVETQKEKEASKGEYNLLAPIGGMTKAPTDVGDYFNKIFLIAIGLCGALAVVMLIIGGIQYMGKESVFGKADAKKQMLGALGGLGIALAAYALLNTINPDLLGKGGVNIKSLNIAIDDEIETEPWLGTAILIQPTKTCPEGYVNVTTTGNPKTINVCKSISGNLTKMINAAAKAGFVLSGYGSRTYDQQVYLREKHNCKPDVLTSPSKSCTPETARPGFSKHESGKAVDFSCNGGSLKGTPCFDWLTQNAKKYGFYNLSGESWHWSDDGH